MGFLVSVNISGADAGGFLHGQFTTDVARLVPGRAELSAWCDPKGRVIATFILSRLGDEFRLLLPEAMKEEFVRRLSMYVLRADVVISDAGDDVPRLPDLAGTGEELSELGFIRQRIPLLHPDTSGRFLPQELNLDTLDAVSFTKGCYPGQEIIARLRYRGAVKRRLRYMVMENEARLNPGAELEPDGVVINSAISNKGQELLVISELSEPSKLSELSELSGSE